MTRARVGWDARRERLIAVAPGRSEVRQADFVALFAKRVGRPKTVTAKVKRRKPAGTSLVPHERVERGIVVVRGQKVMLDTELASLYGVETKNLNKAVKRNLDRFPADFMFQLTAGEHDALRFQSGTSNKGRGGRRYLPYAFTEQGVAMLSSVLNSPRAVQVNIEIVRAFVRLRELLSTHADLARKLDALEKRYDETFSAVFDAIRSLMSEDEEEEKRPRIGFATEQSK